ncbi:MAG: hypothetical protein ACK5JR_06840 [Tropicimonas sp.]|uniref:hypothetical protein n=1 Tax=Tropicimonas sp. TaxID=2067044 RepID=UPI003A8656CA
MSDMTLHNETTLFELDNASISGVTGGNGAGNCGDRVVRCGNETATRTCGSDKPRWTREDFVQRFRERCGC